MRQSIRARVNLSFILASALVLSACGGGSGGGSGDVLGDTSGNLDVPVVPAANDTTDSDTGTSPAMFGPGFNEPTADDDDDTVVEEPIVVFDPSVVDDQPILLDPPAVEDPPIVDPPFVENPPIVTEPQINDEPAEVIDLETPTFQELVAADFDRGTLEVDDLILYETSTATSILLFSFSGDADLFVLDEDSEVVCESISIDVVDICSNLTNGSRYFIGVAGITAAEYEIQTIDTPYINGGTEYSNSVPEGAFFVMVGRGFTAVNLTSLSGDADLRVVNLNNESVCVSLNADNFDSCNNVDSSSDPAIDSEQEYIVVVDGFTDAEFLMQSFSTQPLEPNVAVSSFIELNQEVDFFANSVSTIELSTFSGDADLQVYDASTNELVCESVLPGLDTDVCTVPSGNYRISVFGFNASDYSLTAF